MNILEKLRNGIVTQTPEESAQLAAALAATLPEEAVLTLEGDLGAGKTTFVKGLAKAWNIHEAITSPTFNIYHLFRGDRTLAHMDAYRLDPATEIWEELMLDELLRPPFCLAIEWPGNVPDLPWEITHRLQLKVAGKTKRSIQLVD